VVSDEDAYKTLEAAWNAGVRYYDVSPWYGLTRLHQSPEMASRRSRLDFRLATCRQSSSILGAAGHTGVGVGDASGSRPAGGVDQNRIKAARLA
jgi:aryl-alcohol dehydrogenase-like predicted oxidoreductase